MRTPPAGPAALILLGAALVLPCACSKGSTPDAQPAASVSASAPAKSAPPPPPVTRTFHEIMQAAGPIALAALGPISMVRAGDLAFRIEGGKIVQDPADAVLSRAQSYGTWPKDIVAEVLIERAEMDPHVGAGKLEGKTLTTVVTPGESESTAFLVRTTGDQWLAAVLNGKLEWRWANASAKAGPTPAVAPAAKADGPCKTPFLPDEGFGAGDGLIVAAGFPCASQKTERTPYVARWSSAAREPTLTKLDGVKTSTGRMLVAGRKGFPVYVAHQTEAFLVESAGEGFTPVSVPGPVGALALGPDGTLYAAIGGVLHERKKDGAFTPIATPFSVDAIWVAEDGKLWLAAPRAVEGEGDAKGKNDEPSSTGEKPRPHALFTDAFAAPRLVVVPSSAAVEAGREEGIELGTDACATLSVRVSTGVTKSQKHPILADIVKELGDASKVSFVLDEITKGKLALTAIVPDVETGRKIARAIAPKMAPGKAAKNDAPKAKVACRTPVDRGAVTVNVW